MVGGDPAVAVWYPCWAMRRYQWVSHPPSSASERGIPDVGASGGQPSQTDPMPATRNTSTRDKSQAASGARQVGFTRASGFQRRAGAGEATEPIVNSGMVDQ